MVRSLEGPLYLTVGIKIVLASWLTDTPVSGFILWTDIIPQLTQPASHLPPSTVASLQSPWAVANRQTAFMPLENMKDSRTASIKIIAHEQVKLQLLVMHVLNRCLSVLPS